MDGNIASNGQFTPNGSMGNFNAGSSPVISSGQGDIILAPSTPRNGGKRWLAVVVAVFFLIAVVTGIAALVVSNQTSSTTGYYRNFLTLIENYKELIGLDSSVLYVKNAEMTGPELISKESIERIEEVLVLAEENTPKLSGSMYTETLNILEKIRKNIDFLSRFNSAFMPQTELSQTELVATCGSSNEIEEMIGASDSDLAYLLQEYSIGLCIQLTNQDEATADEQKVFAFKLMRAKVNILATLERITEADEIVEKIQNGEYS